MFSAKKVDFLLLTVMLLINLSVRVAAANDSSIANKSIPLTLHFMYYDDDVTNNRSFTRGEKPLRDIVVDIVNKNHNILPLYRLSMEMHMSRYTVEHNIGPTIETFYQHIIGSSASENNMQQSLRNIQPLLSNVCLNFQDNFTNTIPKQNASGLFVCEKPSQTNVRAPVPLFFGPEVSAEAKVIGQLTPLYNLVTISSQAASAELNDRSRYPNFFRTITSSEAFVNIPRALLAYLNYTTVGLVHLDGALGADSMQVIDSDLRAHQLDVLYKEVYLPGSNDSIREFAKNVQLYDTRVFVIQSNDYSEYTMFCDALNTIGADKFSAENYFFIFLMLSESDIGVLVPSSFDVPNCTQEMLDRLLNGSLVAMVPTWSANKNEPIDMGLTVEQLRDQILNLSRTEKYGDINVTMADTDDSNANTADAFWTGILALDALDKRLRAEQRPRSLLDFTFKSADIAVMLKDEITKVRFRGATGDVHFSRDTGRLQVDIPITQYTPGKGSTLLTPRFNYLQTSNQLEPLSPPVFATRSGQPPPDKKPPPLPYDGAAARRQLLSVILIAIAAVVLVCFTALLSVYVHQKRKLAKSLAHPNWLFNRNQLTMQSTAKSQSYLFGSGGASTYSLSSRRESKAASGSGDVPTYFPTAFLIDAELVVRMQQIAQGAARLQVNEKHHKVLTSFSDKLSHVNVVRFVGYCLYNADQPTITKVGLVWEQYLMWEHCEKGSLEELLDNTAFKLDATFEYALLLDVAQGMAFIHQPKSAAIIGQAHGKLNPAACLIDRRFSVKVAEYGERVLASLFNVKDGNAFSTADEPSVTDEKKLFWAPELLQESTVLPQATRPSDVYAFGMTIYALLARLAPFESEAETITTSATAEILDLIRKPQTEPMRPTLLAVQQHDCRLLTLMQRCWAEQPSERPSFGDIVQHLRIMSRVKGRNNNSSLTDQLLGRLERYASDMESLVAERTYELESEKRRADDLLNRMLPPEIVVELQKNGNVHPESFDSVTIYFSDIVGFTKISSDASPIDIVNLLNALYTMFDAKIDLFDAYKVETIGDAYMVASGLPRRNGSQHVAEIARLSLALLHGMQSFEIPHKPLEKLMLRIGLHTGPCVAGVVGIKMPRYCLFGDTVNTASRMESHGEALKIHISGSTKLALDVFGDFFVQPRGPLEIKGKGIMETYWLMVDGK